MSINLKLSEPVIRETRLGSINGYKGSVCDLARKSEGCALKGEDRGFSQASSCSAACAQTLLSMVEDAAVVNHAPIGCSGETVGSNVTYHWGQYFRNWDYENVRVISTNMTERETVFGGADNLREAVLEAQRRFNPKAVFITASCASGIIGEDIKGMSRDLSEELGIPVVPVHCEGFKSKVWATGFDAAYHAVLSSIVKPPTQKANRVNIINFWGRAKEQIARYLDRLDLEFQFVLPFSSVAELEKISEAAATLSICNTLGSYLAAGLEEHYGVPQVKAMAPHGIAGTESWLRELGKVVGKEEQVEQLIAEERARITSEWEQLRTRLSGLKAVIAMGPGYSHSYVNVLKELGIEVIWLASWHFDQQHDTGQLPKGTEHLETAGEDIPASVNDLQTFEIMNLLKRLKPDLYFTRHTGTSVYAHKLGVATVSITDEYTAFGYDNFIDFGHRVVDALTNRTFARNLSNRLRLPYTDWWMEQDTFAYLKEENQQ